MIVGSLDRIQEKSTKRCSGRNLGSKAEAAGLHLGKKHRILGKGGWEKARARPQSQLRFLMVFWPRPLGPGVVGSWRLIRYGGKSNVWGGLAGRFHVLLDI